MEDEQLRKAIQLTRSGDREAARSILIQLVRDDPHNETAWVWLIEALPAEQRFHAVELFQRANPDSVLAQKALGTVLRQSSEAPKTAIPEPIPPILNPAEPSPAPVKPELVQFGLETAPETEEAESKPVSTAEFDETLDKAEARQKLPEATPVKQKATFTPGPVTKPGETLDKFDAGRKLPEAMPLSEEANLRGEPKPVKVRKTLKRPARRSSNQDRKYVLIVVGIVALAVIMLVVLLVLMNTMGLLNYTPGAFFPTAQPSVTLTPSLTPSPTPKIQPTGTLTNSPTWLNTLTATPPPATETPTPTAFLATPAQASVIVPSNAASVKFFYQSSLPENALVSASLRYMLILDGSSQVRPLDFNSQQRIFIANLPSDSMAVAAFSPDESILAIGIDHSSILVYEMPTGKVLGSLTVSSLTLDNSSSLKFSPDGHFLAASSDDGYIVWDMRTSTVIGEGRLPDGPVVAGQVVHGPVVLVGQILYAPCGNAICTIDAATQKEIQQYPALNNNLVSQFVVSPAGDRIAVQTSGVGNLFSITIYNTEYGTILGEVQTTLVALWGLAYNPLGNLLAAWGQQPTNGQDALVFIDTGRLSQVSSLDIGKVAQSGVGVPFPYELFFSSNGGILAVQTPHALRIFSGR